VLKKGAPDFLTAPDIERVELSWVTDGSVDKNGRTQKAIDKLIDPAYFLNAKAKDVLRQKILAKMMTSNKTSIRFGDFDAFGSKLHKQHIQFKLVKGVEVKLSLDPVTLPPLDPLLGSLGGFGLYAVPQGSATKRPNGRLVVKVDRVGVYAYDVFEFSGEQELGYWRPPNELSYFDPLSPLETVVEGAAIDNTDFRAYRNRTGMGRDFYVMSDVWGYDVDVPTFLL
jgi:Family of unknown function (DUF6402)